MFRELLLLCVLPVFINRVSLHQAHLALSLGNCLWAYHRDMQTANQTQATQPFTLRGMENKYLPKCADALQLGRESFHW